MSEPTTRDAIIAAASALFYEQGLRAVSMDAVAERAGVTKKTLYYHIRSKDDLIAAYLAARDQPNLALFRKWFAQAEGGLAEKVTAIFVRLGMAARKPGWRGCGFQRATAELANLPGHPALVVGRAHKKGFEAFLAQELGQALPPLSAEALARQVSLLMEGAFAMMLLHRDALYIEAAGAAAAALVRGAMSPSGETR